MQRISDVLFDQWIYDVETLSQGWVLWTVFPAMLYVVFMFIKWTVLTCPVWVPVTIIVKAFGRQSRSESGSEKGVE